MASLVGTLRTAAMIPVRSLEIQQHSTSCRGLILGHYLGRLRGSNVVATNVYLDDPKDFSAMNRVYSQYFTDIKPTRTTVAQIPPRPDRGPVKDEIYPTLEQISVIAVR